MAQSQLKGARAPPWPLAAPSGGDAVGDIQTFRQSPAIFCGWDWNSSHNR